MRFALALTLAALVCGCMCVPGSEEAKPVVIKPANNSVKILKNVTNQTVFELHSVGEALFMWSPYLCNFSNQARIGQVTRTQMWSEGGRYHAVTVAGRAGETHVINDGVYVYVWADSQPGPGDKYMISQIKGLREHIEKAEVKANRTVAVPTEYIDLVNAKDVVCRPATLPEGIFTPQKRTFNPGQGAYDYQYDSKLDRYALG
ncbi:MAG: hypothetical protein V1875_02690 [Candidatus Altiarchaeota archaeon]